MITAAYTITAHNIEEVVRFLPFAREIGFNCVRYRLVGCGEWMAPEERQAMEGIDYGRLAELLNEARGLAATLGLAVFIPSLPASSAVAPRAEHSPEEALEPYCGWPYDHVFFDIINTKRKRKMIPCPAWPDSKGAVPDEGDLHKAFHGCYFDECRRLLASRSTAPDWRKQCAMRLGRI